MTIIPPLLRPFSAVNPFEMTCTSPTASMFGFTMAWVPSSSMTFTPSITTTLEVLGMPLIVISAMEVHVVKLRFMFVSWTPGTTARRPQISRPFIGILVSCSAVTVPIRELVAVCTAAVSATTVSDSESWPIFSSSFSMLRTSPGARGTSVILSGAKPLSDTSTV
jgi:hypothetical protein